MSFAQHNDEEIIDRIFGGYVGSFLDIGAFDGESMSNTRALALRGWSGVLVEPSPTEFLKLYALYKDNPKMILVNAAVSGADGLRPFWPDSTDHRYGSTLNRDWANKSHIAGAASYWVNAIGIRTVSTFGQFDFVSIDTEGEDFEILRKGHWDNVKLLCVETSANPNAPWLEQLTKHKFKPYATTLTNLYAVPE